MRCSGKAVMCFCLLLIALGVVLSALQWPIKTAVFPIGIGSIIFVMAMIELLFTLMDKEKGIEEKDVMDFKLSRSIDPALARQRTISIFLWIIGFFFMILFLGMPVALPLFLFLYIKVSGKEGWKISLGLTAGVWICFYFLFMQFLKIQFRAGWLQDRLRMFIS